MAVASMHLDVGTLSVVTVFVAALLGALLVFAGLQNRSIRAPMWWGAANIVGALGLGLAASDAPEFLAIDIANALVLLGYGLTWAGARVFDGRKVLPLVVVFAPSVWLCACRIGAFENSSNLRTMVVSAMTAMLAAATAEEFWRGRAEPLLSRWPTVVVLLAYAAALLARIPATSFSPLFDSGSVLEGLSFALIAFGTLLFTVVMSFLLLNMTKERTELQHKINAMIDPLSGVANRRAFLDGASQLLVQQDVDNEPLAMLLFDLDRFKEINDRMGHAVGDRVLQTFAVTTTATLGSEILFGRIGGEEFAALMPVGDLGEAYAVADRIRRNFCEAAARFANGGLVPTVSVGLTVNVLAEMGSATNCALAEGKLADLKQRVDTLLEIADRALYRAKANGRNRVEATAPIEEGASPLARAPSIVPLIKTEPVMFPQARGWRRRVAQ
jgi:diguanylate cyclase (GGDEF)-like protein